MVDGTVNESFASKLASGEGSFRSLRLFIFLVLIGGIAFFGWNFRKIMDLSVEEPVFVPPVAGKSQEDAKRLDGIVENYRATTEARRASKNTAEAVIDDARRPFAMTERKVEERVRVAAAGESPVPDPLETMEALPPIMFVRAIMVAGKDAIAIMDINGVGNGIIVKTGFSFLEKQGRIVRITPDKVTVRWIGKNIDITPGL